MGYGLCCSVCLSEVAMDWHSWFDLGSSGVALICRRSYMGMNYDQPTDHRMGCLLFPGPLVARSGIVLTLITKDSLR